MMISKKNLNGNPIHLNEGFISDKIASVKEKREVAKNIAKYKNDSKFLKIILKSSNKNIKDILATKGDFSKYPAYDDIKYIITTIERVSGGVLPQDLSTVLTNVKKGIDITVKYEKEFKKAFASDIEFIKLTYLGLTTSIVLSISLAYSKYLVTNNGDGRVLSIDNHNHKISERKACISLGEYIAKETSGELIKIIREGIKSSNLSEDTMAEHEPYIYDNYSIPRMIFAILVDSSKNENTFLGKLFKFLYLTKKDANNPDKNQYSLMTKVIIALSIIVGFIVAARYCISEYFEVRVKLAESLREAADNLRATAETDDITAENRDKKLKAAERYAKLAEKIDLDLSVSESKTDRDLSRLDQITDKQARDMEKESGTEIDFGI